jgi:CRP-like cAMP-binding protein
MRWHAPTADWLGRFPELASFELVELGRSPGRAQTATSAQGVVVIIEGDAPDKLYVVRSGRFDVLTSSPLVAGVAPPDLGPDDPFGEIGLLGGMRWRVQHTHPDSAARNAPPEHDVEQVGAGT